MRKKTRKLLKIILYWTARVLGILYIIFLSLFALDSERILGFVMHMIPSFLLILLLAISWKWERIGGLSFLLVGCVFTLFFKTYQDIIEFFIISFPVLLIGVLFIINNIMETKKEVKKHALSMSKM